MKKRITEFILCITIFFVAPCAVQAAPVNPAQEFDSAPVSSEIQDNTASEDNAASEIQDSPFSSQSENPTDGSVDLFSDGVSQGSINALAQDLTKRTQEEAEKYKAQMRKQQRVRAQREKALEEKRKAEEEKRKAEEEERKAEEEKRRAEEEARRKEEEKRKAEEARLAKRKEIVNYALQFEGNPYVYGGTSLTNGADCSGFVMSVFAQFGYELPRVAAAQYDSAVKKDLEALEPGDLLFYGSYGIDHVALYIGDGQVIHASTSATGIKISDYDYRQPIGAGTYVE